MWLAHGAIGPKPGDAWVNVEGVSRVRAGECSCRVRCGRVVPGGEVKRGGGVVSEIGSEVAHCGE